MRSSTFRNVTLGILALALAYHLGARSTSAQAPGNPVVGCAYGSSAMFLATANGDVYVWGGGNWSRLPNVFGGATSTAPMSVGQLKTLYR